MILSQRVINPDAPAIRPGAANGAKKTQFARRAQGLEPVEYAHRSLAPALRSTFGVVAYEEHILQICELFAGLPPDPAVYFVHSYFPQPTNRDVIAAEADYPTPFCSVVWKGNVYATQFHPEKSQDVGLRMLKNFAEV